MDQETPADLARAGYEIIRATDTHDGFSVRGFRSRKIERQGPVEVIAWSGPFALSFEVAVAHCRAHLAGQSLASAFSSGRRRSSLGVMRIMLDDLKEQNLISAPLARMMEATIDLVDAKAQPEPEAAKVVDDRHPSERLMDGIADMIAGRRLTERDVPDDWDWLLENVGEWRIAAARDRRLRDAR